MAPARSGCVHQAFDAVFSKVLGVHVGGSLLTASIRCILQLSVMALILQSVFDARNIWAAAGISRELVVRCLVFSEPNHRISPSGE